MYLVESIEFYDDNGGGEAFLTRQGEGAAKSSEYLDDIHLMQYTGFRDKNNVEIYEGDIVTVGHEPYTSEDDNGNEITAYESTHRSRIWWDEDSGAFLVAGGDHGFFGGEFDTTAIGWAIYDGEYELEVIGNIHENPDLLRGGDA